MKGNFDWQSEDESLWEIEGGAEGSQLPRKRRHWNWLIPLLLMVCVFAAVFITIQRRLSWREKTVIEDIAATQSIIQQAVKDNDLELFTEMLAREDPQWFLSQRRLFLANRLFNRESFGIRIVESHIDGEDIQPYPDWRSAEGTIEVQYQTILPDDSLQTIRLLHSQYFEKNGDRWQLSQPDESFWGGQATLVNARLTVSYPARDAAIVQRITRELTAEIDALCTKILGVEMSDLQRTCDSELPLTIAFDATSESLLGLADLSRPAFSGRSFRYPTPTLVGLPVDEVSYRALYTGYTSRIIDYLRNILVSPIPLPDQKIMTLCFPTREDELGLYTYDPRLNQWTPQKTDRRYSYLQALPMDDGLILRGGFPGTNIGNLQLALIRSDRETLLLEDGNTELSARLLEIVPRPQDVNLVISLTRGNTGLTSYQLVSLAGCEVGSCVVKELPGYPVWSPDGEQTLVTQGSELFLGDGQGQLTQHIDRAFSPFWLSPDLFGYVQLLQGDASARPDTQLVLQSRTNSIKLPLVRSSELLKLLGKGDERAIRIQYVAANPIDPTMLFLGGSPVTAGQNRFLVLKLTLSGLLHSQVDELRLMDVQQILEIDSLPEGNPLVFTPTGYHPYSITGDGRWLLLTNFVDPVTNRWLLYLYDIERNVIKTYTLHYPPYPAPFPFYDWSADWQWLLMIDNGYLRLVAPEQDYERLVPHEFTACRYSAWVN